MEPKTMKKTATQTMLEAALAQPCFIRHDGTFIDNTIEAAAAVDGITIEAKRDMVQESLAANIVDAVVYEAKPYAQINGVAVVPVRGMLLNRFAYAFPWVTGYNFIRAAVQAATEDETVRMILLDIDSIGGTAAGCFETSEIITEANAVKPVVAFVDSYAYSAAYAIASACGKIYTTRTANVGSIGVVLTHMSYEKKLAEEGVEVTIIQAGDRKSDGNPFKALSSEAKSNFQTSVDSLYGMFVQTVATNRNLSVDEVTKMQAGCYNADQALEAKLIDAVIAPNQLLSFLDESGKEDDMTVPNTPATAPATAPTASQAGVPVVVASAASVTGERERIKAITTAPEAQGRSELAAYLAFDTSMSATEALAILGKAPVEQAAAPAAPVEQAAAPAAPVDTALDTAMRLTAQPGIAADTPTDNPANGAMAFKPNQYAEILGQGA